MNNFSKKVSWVVIILIIAVGAIFLSQRAAEPNDLPIIRLGLGATPYSGLAKVALDKNFFTDEGLRVEVKEFTGGKFALQALMGGSLDLAAPAEFPITLAALNGEKLFVLSEIARTEGASRMVLRKEDGSLDPELFFAKKRKIATSVGADAEFFSAQFFKKYNIQPSQYEIVSMKPEDMPIALANNSVDGIAIYEPFAYFAEQQAGSGKVFSIKSSDLYSATMVLAGRPEWVVKNQENIRKFLRALQSAENFIKANQEESMAIISSFTKLDKEVLRNIWATFDFRLGLSSKLIQTMAAEAQWAKDTGKTSQETVIPNFREIIFDTPLKKLAPAAIDL